MRCDTDDDIVFDADFVMSTLMLMPMLAHVQRLQAGGRRNWQSCVLLNAAKHQKNEDDKCTRTFNVSERVPTITALPYVMYSNAFKH
jgi:MinD-like ATPase involved in chromosome partitioning or flagellar assembly